MSKTTHTPVVARLTIAQLAVGLLAAVATAFVLGGLTSFGQMLLPDALQSFANSASGWTVLTVLTVWALHRGTWPSALYGAAGFVALVMGYQVVSGWRGFFYDPSFWLMIGVVVGPFVGVAASWMRTDGFRAAAGTALLAGIGVGEAVYGLTVVAETTSPVYWILIGAAGLVLLARTLARAGRDPLAIGVGVGGTVLVAAAFLGAYTSI